MRPQRPQQSQRSIDRAALTRQFLAGAVDRVVDTGLPQLTQVDVGLPPTANVKNEPTAPAAGSSPFVNRNKPPAPAARQPSASSAPAVDAGLRQLTPVDAMQRKCAPEKTNPPRRAAQATGVSMLSSRQLAAARLLACGRSPADVADEIGITRQALWKWRRRREFDAEVFRLHECLTWTAGATTARRRRTPI
jgi:hypothetical protein